MTDHFNGLSAEEDELLAVLSEECSEVIQAVCKIQRHGIYSRNPHSGECNVDALEKEIGHLNNIITMLIEHGVLNVDAIASHSQMKKMTIGRYLHHNK